MHRAAFYFDERPADIDRAPAAGEDIPTRHCERPVAAFVLHDRPERLAAQREDDSSDAGPEDRACTHRAGLGARVEGGTAKDRWIELLPGGSNEVELGVSGAVASGHDGVLGLEHDGTVRGNEERAERMIAVFPGSSGELDRATEVLRIGVHAGIQHVRGRLVSTVCPVSFRTIDELEHALRGADYLPDRGLSTALFLSLALEKPLLLEGEAGVGKTEAAKALASALEARLIRLQCYEGLDVAHAVYEWNYPRQLLHIRAAQEGTVSEDELFGPEFLIRRPLLEAIDSEGPVVLLIDEVDRADEEFEAFLLEVLSDFQITIPEIGTISARRRPAVVLTSNRTRELHDALKRRALFHWIGHPTIDREIEIVKLRVPGIPERLAAEAAAFVRGLRGLDLAKPPGVAETIDWAHALSALGREVIDAEVVEQTLGSVLKYREDIEAVRDETLADLVAQARSAG